MVTARLDARRAAAKVTPRGQTNAHYRDAADAASDVWEPLLRQAVELAETFYEYVSQDAHTDAELRRLKEALG